MSGAAPAVPRGDPDSAGFWAAVDGGSLALCRCEECSAWLQPPLERCRHCGGATTFVPASGHGVVYSYIVVRHPSWEVARDMCFEAARSIQLYAS